MTSRQERALRRLVRGIDASVKKFSVTLVPIVFGSCRKGGWCCAVTAFAGKRARSATGAFRVVRETFKVTDKDVWDLVDGFDGNDKPEAGWMHAVGQALRVKYLSGGAE